MRKNIKHLTFSSLIFLVLMAVSGASSGWISEVLYVLSFAAPVLFLLWYRKDELGSPTEYLTPGGRGMLTFVALGAPTVVLVIGISYLTSLLIKAVTGVEQTISTDEPFFLALLLSALLPAVLEEMLFRYLPMKLLLPLSPRVCVLFSAVVFAVAHRSLFSLVYAFAAGVLFMVMDVAAKSVWPSVILHFINNALSLSLAYFGNSSGVVIGIFVTLGLLLCLSLAVFIAFGRKVGSEIRYALSGGVPYGTDLVPLFFIIPCLLFAVGEFFI